MFSVVLQHTAVVISIISCIAPFTESFLIKRFFAELPKISESHFSRELILQATPNRREFLETGLILGFGGVYGGIGAFSSVPEARAIGSLPEFQNDAMFVQHAAINVPDLDASLTFFQKALGMHVLRSRILNGNNITFVGYGPEQLSVPEEFVPGVSSFNEYGGHFSLKLVSPIQPNPAETSGPIQEGNVLKYLQIAVPYYSIGKMIAYGGTIEYGYGWLKVTAPGNLPLQVFFGDRAENFMFVALQVQDLKKSIEFYQKELGMKKLPYLLLRDKGSIFEPSQPKGSQLMGYSPEGTGILLLPKGKEDAGQGSVFAEVSLLSDIPLAVSTSTGTTYTEMSAVTVQKNQQSSASPIKLKDLDGHTFVITEKQMFDNELKSYKKLK